MSGWLNFDKFTKKHLSKMRIKKKVKEDFILALVTTYLSETQEKPLDETVELVKSTFTEKQKEVLLEGIEYLIF